MNHQQLQLAINWLGLDIDMVQNAKAVVELLEYVLRGSRDGGLETGFSKTYPRPV